MDYKQDKPLTKTSIRHFKSYTPMTRGEFLRVHSRNRLVELWRIISVRRDPDERNYPDRLLVVAEVRT